MTTFFAGRKNRLWLLAITLFTASAPAQATLIRDQGIYLAGPFDTPDIHQPPSASKEAVFLAGSTARAPLFLNECVVGASSLQATFSDNGFVNGSAFTAKATDDGANVRISWDLSGTHYAMKYISVNFDNNFYHVYAAEQPALSSEGQFLVTGNSRDTISYIHFFGVSTVPDSGTTAVMLAISVGAIILGRRCRTTARSG
jgi:VPDSG-CTERM motif